MTMKEQINKLKNLLQGEFILVWILALVFVVLNECGILTQGTYAEDASMKYILQTVGILLACAMLPISLRSYSKVLLHIREFPLQKAFASYRRWNEIRLAMLFVPAILNLSIHYQTMESSCLFCACMMMSGMFFCIPTRNRIMNELDLSEETNG